MDAEPEPDFDDDRELDPCVCTPLRTAFASLGVALLELCDHVEDEDVRRLIDDLADALSERTRTTERWARAARLHGEGATLPQIADRLCVTTQRARLMVAVGKRLAGGELAVAEDEAASPSGRASVSRCRRARSA